MYCLIFCSLFRMQIEIFFCQHNIFIDVDANGAGVIMKIVDNE
jgi:hypothetical protein